MLRGRVGRGAFPPSQRLDVLSLASSSTTEHEQAATRWALDDLAATLINRAHHDQAMSRSTIFRVLDEADLKPHRSVYWLNSHDPDFDTKARAGCVPQSSPIHANSPIRIGSRPQCPGIE